MIEEMVARLRAEHADAVAVVLKGSHARGEAGPWSDIDFDVLVSTPDTEIYRTWLERDGDRLVHVSAAVESIENWLADAEHPVGWSLGLDADETTRLLWAASDELRTLLDQPAKSHPAMEPEVEDSVEYLGKIHNALSKGDAIGVYRNAQKLAHLIPTLLIPVNPPVIATNSRRVVELITAMPNVPQGFAEDWLTCIGYVDARTPESTAQAAERLVRGALALLPPDPESVGDDIARIMSDGSLYEYLEMICGNKR